MRITAPLGVLRGRPMPRSPLLASSLCPMKRQNKEAPRRRASEAGGEAQSGGVEFGVSNNVRCIDSEGSAFVARPLPLGRSRVGPNCGACHPAHVN